MSKKIYLALWLILALAYGAIIGTEVYKHNCERIADPISKQQWLECEL